MTLRPALTVADFGVGNVASIMNMARRIGAAAILTDDASIIRAAQRLVLPGVGAFDHGIRQLRARGLFDLVREKAAAGTPLLGVCLGMQMLARGSEEGREHGLGLIDGECRRFAFSEGTPLRIPHVGWNEPTVVRDNPLLSAEGTTPRFYFTHGYHLVCEREEDVLATVDYGYAFPAIVGRGNVFGVQFHPEKSHRFGMELLRRFSEVPAC